MTNSLSLRDNVNRINNNNCWLCFIQQNILKGNGACLQGEQNFAKFLQYFMIQCMHDETHDSSFRSPSETEAMLCTFTYLHKFYYEPPISYSNII